MHVADGNVIDALRESNAGVGEKDMLQAGSLSVRLKENRTVHHFAQVCFPSGYLYCHYLYWQHHFCRHHNFDEVKR